MPTCEAHLQTLSLDQTATFEEIREAYQDLVMVWHPDRFMHNPRLYKKAEEKLKQFNQAYAYLKGQQTNAPHPTPQQSSSPSPPPPSAPALLCSFLYSAPRATSRNRLPLAHLHRCRVHLQPLSISTRHHQGSGLSDLPEWAVCVNDLSPSGGGFPFGSL